MYFFIFLCPCKNASAENRKRDISLWSKQIIKTHYHAGKLDKLAEIRNKMKVWEWVAGVALLELYDLLVDKTLHSITSPPPHPVMWTLGFLQFALKLEPTLFQEERTEWQPYCFRCVSNRYFDYVCWSVCLSSLAPHSCAPLCLH